MSESLFRDMVSCMHSQAEAYGKMYEITQRLLSLCDQDDFPNESGLDALESLIQERQLLIDDISRIQLGEEKIRSELAAVLGVDDIRLDRLYERYPREETIKTKELYRKVAEKVQELVKTDQKARQLMEKKLGDTRRELKRVQDGRHTNRAYSGYQNIEYGHFIDKKR